MREHRIPIPNKCIHGVFMNKDCIKCLEFFITDYQTQVRILKAQLRVAKNKASKRSNSKVS